MLLCRILLFAALVPQSDLDEARRRSERGDSQGAIAILEPHLASHPDDAEATALLAWLYTSTGNLSLSAELYRALVLRRPADADLHNSLGALLFKMREVEEARRELETATRLEPTLVMAHYNLGLLRFEEGELTAAAQSFERAAALDRRKFQYAFALARTYRAAYEFEKAEAAYRSGLALSPPPDVARTARLELALALRLNGRFDPSEAELRGILGEYENDPEALFQLGRLELARNRYPAAEAAFRRLVDVQPGNAPGRFMLGFVSYREDEPEEAAASFRKLLELEPRHPEGRYFLGLSLQKLLDRKGARAAFEETLRVDPAHASAAYNLALLLAREGEREESAKWMERFVELSSRRERLAALEERVRWDPGNAEFYFDLGQEYSRQSRKQEALQAFQRALELDPTLAAAEVAILDLLSSQVR